MSSLEQKLSVYQQANRGIQYSNLLNHKVTQAIALGLLPSLAQLSLLSGQCQGIQATNLALPSNSSSGLNIDVDGDGTDDFKIFDNGAGAYAATLHIVALNGGAVLTNGGSGTVRNYGAGQAINGNATNQYGGYWWLVFRDLVPNNQNIIGPWSDPYPTSGYIGIKQGGNYGFIQLTVNSGPTDGVTGTPYNISVSEAGLADDPSVNVLAGQCNGLLPVELTEFRASVAGKTVVLDWETASEQNNAGFEIQRSIDGSRYETLSFVEGKGSVEGVNRYSFTDQNPSGSQSYYRLKQVDYDGQYEYSRVVSVRLAREEAVGQLYPNPANAGAVNLDFTVATNNENWKISIYDVAGKLLLTEQRTLAIGNSTQQFDLSQFAPGTYFFRLESGEQRIFRKAFVR